MNELSTSRLIGTPAGPGDLADIRRLHSDRRVMATLSADGNTFSEDQSRAFLARAYNLKTVADYETGDASQVTVEEAQQAIEAARRFVACIEELLA